MRPSFYLPALAAIIVLGGATAQARSAGAEPKTEAAVRAASDDWLAAERRGDVTELDRRLMPQYRDITVDGEVHPRAALIAHAAALKDPSTVPAKALAAAFRKAHPVVEKVVITGDVALLSYLAPDPQAADQVGSMDVFVYDHGRWRALVSTHNSHA